MDKAPITPVLAITGLRIAYGMREIISEFQLKLREKECVGLVGTSGSGKSTVLKGIVGLTPARAGEAWLNSEHFLAEGALTVHPWSLRRQLTLVTQQSGLQPYKTIRDNIALVATTILKVGTRDAMERTVDVAVKLGIAEQLDSYPDQLSGGQLQRAHLARALILKPPVLLLDEITSSVDPRTSEAICSAVQQTSREHGTSVILVSHDFSVVRRLADRVVFLHDGKNFEEVLSADFPEGFKTPEARTFTAGIVR